MRTKVAGGAALGILALGLWLGSQMGGFGLGTFGLGEGGESIPEGNSQETPVDPGDINVSTETPITTPGPTRPGVETSGAIPESPHWEVMPILIDKDGYRIPGAGTDFKSEQTPDISGFITASLETVVNLAVQTKGNSFARVRLFKDPLASAQTRSDLIDALIEAGIREDMIKQSSDFVR